MLLSGIPVANSLLNATKLQISEHQLTPGLGVILVGNDAPSHLYVGIKERRAQELGIFFEKKVFPSDVSLEEVREAIEAMNADKKLHGIILQLPLPEHLDADALIQVIDPKKDTDGFHPVTIEKFLAGDKERTPVFPRAMLELLQAATKEKGKALAVVNSALMGRVLTHALSQAGWHTQYVTAQATDDIARLFPEQEAAFTAVGTPGIVSATQAKAGAVIIDGGISYDSTGAVIGDVSRDDGVYREDVWVTPVPGGVGPVTVAVLLARVTEAALRTK